MSNEQPAVLVKDLYKTFKLPLENHSGIKQVIVNAAKRKKGYELQEVLNGVSFEIKKGEFFGIVGRNGSGKSTLLKLLAGIYVPDSGLVQVNGSLTPFIELGVGFNPELTGYENVFLNGALLGFSRKEMEEMYSDIVSFAELERFMDQKLKNYSSGMQVRLAFSIAIRARSDILLLDEVLAVGDEAFQRKCYEYFEDLKREKRTVIIVTHDMGAVEKFCDRAILIEKGTIIKKGNQDMVADAYSELFKPAVEIESEFKEDEVEPTRWGDKRLEITSCKTRIPEPDIYNSPISITMTLKCNTQIKNDVIAAYAVKDSVGQKLFGNKVKMESLRLLKPGDATKIEFTFPNILNAGRYFVDLSLHVPEDDAYADCWIDCGEFRTKAKGVDGYPIIVKDQAKER